MSTLSTDERAELEALRARVAALEEERAAEIARLSAALGEAQERVYWLDRWRIDLNALMRRPGASEFRAALRAARAVVRALKSAGRVFGR
jgi:hypothetical protein